ncbi:MAG: insulinase family protein [Nanoarchaeota archaeon]
MKKIFFSNYSYSNPAPKTKLQEPFNSPKEKEIEYPVIGNPENKYYYIYSFALSKSTEIEEVIGLEILNEILFEMNASPIKKALNEAELGEDIYTTLENENLQTILTLVLVNSNAENKEKFKDILFENLEKLSKKIDKNLVLSAINKVEFQFKELIDYEDGFTKGLLIWRNIMKSWLHETDEPLKQIKTNKIFENIRNSKNYFEKLITKYLLENKHSCFITLKPNPELNEHEKELEKLKQIQKNLTPEELNEIKTQTKQMEKYLSEVKNDSLLMPCLDPKEISSKQKKIEFEEKTISEIKIKNYLANTNQITYVNFFFDINNLSFEEYQYVSLLAEMLEKTKTQNYTEVEISNLVNTYTGGIDFSIIPLETKNRELKILFLFSTKFLDLNSEKIPEIITEILNNAKFEIKKIKEVLKEIKSDLSLGLIESGHITAITRNESNFSKLGKVNEHISGITYYEFCKKLLDIFDGNKIKSKLEEIYSKIFSKENLILNVNSENKNFEKIIPKFELKSKSEITTDKTEIKINLEKKSEGICANSQVNYVTLGANIKDLEFEFNANYLILKNYLRYDYLWNTIRAKYGAYGAGAKITKNGNFTFFSFRDPNIKESLKVYENLPVELENFNLTKEEYDRLIIGTISDYEKEHDPNEKALRALFREFLGYTHADIEKEKSEILNSNINEMKKLAKPVVEIIKQNNLCVLGNEKKIKENKERFEEIINLD